MSERIKFAQISDVHIESPFAYLPAEKGALRRSELREDFAAAIAGARAFGAQLVLLPGDLFDHNFITESVASAVIDLLRGAGDMLFFLAPGNHDFLEKRSPYERYAFPKNVHIFRSGNMEQVRVDAWNLSVYGCAGAPRPNDRPPLPGFCVRDRSRLNLGVVHGHVAAHWAVPYAPITPEDIAGSGLDYLAIGHVHTYTGLQRAGAVPYAYTGCIEGRGFDECGPKGMILGEAGKDGCEIEFVDLARRHMHIVEVDITGCMTAEQAAAACRAAAGGIPECDLVRFELTGMLAAGAEIDAPLVAALCGAFFYTEAKDRTARAADWEKLSGENTLRGRFVREGLQAIAAAQSEKERAIAARALTVGLAALSGEKVPECR